MNKLLTLVLVSGLGCAAYAQEAADKKVQAGLVTGFGLNFQKMGTKLMSSDGAGNDLTIGANVNFGLTETIALNTGIEFDFETLKYMAGTNPVYYRYNDTEILAQEAGTDNELFRLTTRKQKATYLTLPVMMMFRTNYIGYFRYFGKFGLRNSILLSSKMNDSGYNYNFDVNPVAEEVLSQYTASTHENMTAKGEMFVFKSAVGLSGGVEWNFVGSTCLVGEIGYYYGFTPLHTNRKAEKSYLFNTDVFGNNPEYFSNKATQGQLMFKVSILF
jgi:hypothetical protein